MPRGAERVCDRRGRPLGPRWSAVPQFTARRLALRMSVRFVARALTHGIPSAGLAGISTTFQAIAEWESGACTPSADRVALLAVILQTSAEACAAMFPTDRVRSHA